MRRSPTRRATTPPSRAGSPSARRTSRRSTRASFEKVLDLPYGENPHQRAAFYAQVGSRTHLLSMVSKLHGQGAVVQQPARPRLGPQARSTSSSCRRRRSSSTTTPAAWRWARAWRRRSTRRWHRSDERLRRRHVLQPQGRPRPGREAQLDVRGAGVRSRLRRRRARGAQQKENLRILEDDGAPRHRDHRAGPEARARRAADPGPRRRHRRSARRCRWSPSASRPRRQWGELLFAWKVCKHVRSNAIVLSRDLGDGGHRRRPDEPRGLGAHRHREGRRRGHRRWTAR